MTTPGTVQMKIIAGVIAFLSVYFIHGPVSWLCGSPIGGTLVALGAGFAIFMLLCVKFQGSAVDRVHPQPRLYELTTIRALASIKTALQTKYFDDKHWHFEMLEPEEGTAFFVCKYQEHKNEKEPPKDRTVLLHVKVDRISDAASVRLDYELVGITTLELEKPIEFCKQTTEYIEQQLQAAAAKVAA